MASNNFHIHLASLESEYGRLQAENIGLRQLLTHNAARHEEQCFAFEGERRSPDAEALLPYKQVFERDGIHQMMPSPLDAPHHVAREAAEEIVMTRSRSNSKNSAPVENPQIQVAPKGDDGRLTLPADGRASSDTRTSSKDGQRGVMKYFKSFTKSHTHLDEGVSETETPEPTKAFAEHASYAAEARSSEGRKPIFADAEAMKERVRQQIYKKRYDVADFYKEDGFAQRLARNQIFEIITLCVIGSNALWIAIDTDFNDALVLVDADWGFQLVENLFCAYFFLEIVVRFVAFDNKLNCCRDMWFVFDFFLVFMMVLETWVMSFIITVFSGGGGAGVGNLSILRIGRLFRLTRMARMARLLRAVPELVILIKGMFAAARSVFFTLLLLLILLYVFAIAFVQTLKDTPQGLIWFPNVPESMNTLWLYATLLEDIPTLTYALKEQNPWILILLNLYILAAALTVMNMLIGVLCEVVSAVASQEKEEVALSFVKAKVERIFYGLGLDEDHNGMISKKEFVHIVENQEAARAINDLGVDVVDLVDMADIFFEDEGQGGYAKEISFQDFMEMVTQFRSKNVATVKDVVNLQKALRLEINKMKSDVTKLVSPGTRSVGGEYKLASQGIIQGRKLVYTGPPHSDLSSQDSELRVSSNPLGEASWDAAHSLPGLSTPHQVEETEIRHLETDRQKGL